MRRGEGGPNPILLFARLGAAELHDSKRDAEIRRSPPGVTLRGWEVCARNFLARTAELFSGGFVCRNETHVLVARAENETCTLYFRTLRKK